VITAAKGRRWRVRHALLRAILIGALVVGLTTALADGASLARRSVHLRGASTHQAHTHKPHTAPLPRPRAIQSIVGGSEAAITRFPFQVALYDPQAGSPAAGFFCGGVILDATHVITAAHCVAAAGHGSVSAPAEIEVLAGSTRLAPIDPGSVRDPVAAATYDPHYNPFTSDYDVGMLTLVRRLWSGDTPPSLDGTSTIAPLPPNAAQAASYASPNAAQPVIATVSGWGDVNPAPASGPSYPLVLQSVRVPLVPEWQCAEDYAAIEQTITPRMICAGDSRHRADSCYGDSGGPLVVDRDSPAHPPADYVLVGLVDFGNGCAQAGYPGVYTRITDPDIERFLATGGVHGATIAGRQSKKKRRHRR
jgi:secreted trypsin-like serine protease